MFSLIILYYLLYLIYYFIYIYIYINNYLFHFSLHAYLVYNTVTLKNKQRISKTELTNWLIFTCKFLSFLSPED